MSQAGGALGVVLAALVGAWASARLAKVKSRWWVAGYVVPLLLVAGVGLIRWGGPGCWRAPLTWYAVGRTKYAVMGFAFAMLFLVPAARLPKRWNRRLVRAFAGAVILLFAVGPLAWPALYYRDFKALPTVIDGDGVCRQSTSYTCGPAAAVTGLRRLGFHAREGDLAILACTSPRTGTQPDMLREALDARFGAEGLEAEYRAFETLADLRAAGLMLAEVEVEWPLGHWVAVLGIREGKVIVADPSKGLLRIPWTIFKERWLFRGIVLRRRP